MQNASCQLQKAAFTRHLETHQDMSLERRGRSLDLWTYRRLEANVLHLNILLTILNSAQHHYPAVSSDKDSVFHDFSVWEILSLPAVEVVLLKSIAGFVALANWEAGWTESSLSRSCACSERQRCFSAGPKPPLGWKGEMEARTCRRDATPRKCTISKNKAMLLLIQCTCWISLTYYRTTILTTCCGQ